ncbi:hypothetical protein MACH09_01520 [Vibrio sp. MACH09]|uniref:polysialyltransferase family glycosyltransferase n=1 Tax=Vibrio sp. MACH09 TaxID=3025122 RepID=UPI00278ECC7D|nr:polysialyltransferase family glycosyltransferase [Vibrio sp. MACH09]GLO59644.1 hypothetical protein MACH09_01520 [Vibrio sp. MACH09]
MNVFIVTSPFQYICANEARLAYNSKDNTLILIEQDNPAGIQQMAAILQEDNWDSVLRFPRNKRTTTIPKIIKSITAITAISNNALDTLFYSEYNAWRTKLLMRNLSFKKHVFFDDGTMTFADYYDHIEPKKIYHRSRWFQDSLLRLQGIQPIGEIGLFKNTELFSIFSFPNCILKYKENKLLTLQLAAEEKRDEHQINDIFIGQGCIDEKGHASLNEYLTQIEQASRKSSLNLLYIPHRTEAAHVTQAIKKLANIRYHQPQYPIEIELIKTGIQPNCIFGLSSTALYTLSKIYPNSSIQLIEQPEHMSKSVNRVQKYLHDYFLK